MFDRILVPLDGSKRAEAILPHLEELACCLHSTLVLVQVVEPVMLPYDPQGYMPELDTARTEQRHQEAADYLESVAVRLRALGLEVQTRVDEGAVVESLLEICASEHASLIALASHGRTGLARVFYGSVADGLLHSTCAPLMVVRSV